jgi:hypothetical protein
MLVDVSGPTGSRRLAIEVKGNGEPRFIRQAIYQLKANQRFVEDAYPVIMAPSLSPQATEMCRQAGIGYIDYYGNCHLQTDGIHIHIEGLGHKQRERRHQRTLFSPKAERVARVLLAMPEKAWKMQDLATTADVSLGQVANVKRALLDREWLDTTPTGIRLTAPMDLLSAWNEAYDFSKHRRHLYYSRNPLAEVEWAIGEVANRHHTRYALTGFSGAARIAPHVRYQRVMVYVDDNIQRFEEQLNLKPVTSGANVILIEPYDEGIFFRPPTPSAHPVVCNVQLYLDLMKQPDRGQEAAEFLLEQEIVPRWN